MNGTPEKSLVHDMKVLKSDEKMDKEHDMQFVSRLDSVKTVSDQLKEDVGTVRKMKGRKGEQEERERERERGTKSKRRVDRKPEGDRGFARTGTIRSTSSSPLHCSELKVQLWLRSPKQTPVNLKD